MSARDLAWRAGAPARIVLLASIRAYQLTVAGSSSSSDRPSTR
jgi:hypothetical protein